MYRINILDNINTFAMYFFWVQLYEFIKLGTVCMIVIFSKTQQNENCFARILIFANFHIFKYG